MKVWIATWDVRNAGAGVEVYASKALAVDAALDYANIMELLGSDTLTEAAARELLETTGEILFEDAACYYGIEEHEVNGLRG